MTDPITELDLWNAKAAYEAFCERLRREADEPGGVGSQNVHCRPFDHMPEPHQRRLAQTVRDHYAKQEQDDQADQ